MLRVQGYFLFPEFSKVEVFFYMKPALFFLGRRKPSQLLRLCFTLSLISLSYAAVECLSLTLYFLYPVVCAMSCLLVLSSSSFPLFSFPSPQITNYSLSIYILEVSFS